MGLLDALLGNASEAPVTKTFGRKVDAKASLGLLSARVLD